MNKCDICNRFGELETVTLEVKKHKECDVNGLFKTQAPIEPRPAPVDLTNATASVPVQLIPNGAPPYVAEELKRMIL